MWQQTVVEKTEALSELEKNAEALGPEIAWLEQVIQARGFQSTHQPEEMVTLKGDNCQTMLPPHGLFGEDSEYSKFVSSQRLNGLERLILILALVPVIKPQLLDMLLGSPEQNTQIVTELGLVERGGSLYASGATAAFLSGSDDLANRFVVLELLQKSPALQKVLHFNAESQTSVNVSLLSAPLSLKTEHLQLFTTGRKYRPELSSSFPASRIDTSMEFDDLVLPNTTQNQLEEIKHWLQHGDTLLNDWGIGKQLRPGYRALFYGPPGTGKTLTASVLGNALGMDVYRIDVSMVTSKYIGETEKNLEQVFSLAEDRNWILFFDEADALFGKRLNTNSSNDQFANQNVAYLLQRIEGFNGLVILASNYKDNIDNAFFRRFESIVQFPAPKAEQRLRIWQSGFCNKTHLAYNVSLQHLAERHSLSGAEIINVLRFVSLKLLSENRTEVLADDIQQGIKRVTEHQSQPRW